MNGFNGIRDKIRQYVFKYIDANMYVLVEDNEALVIDPHIDIEAEKYLKDNFVGNVTILLTHEHFDHTCGVKWFQVNYNSKVICQENVITKRGQKTLGSRMTISFLLSDQGREEERKELETEYEDYMFEANRVFDNELKIKWRDHDIAMYHTPGHSPGSCIITIDKLNVFTGDSLIPDCEPTLRWPGSDKSVYIEKVIPMLLKIPQESIIYPGHRQIIRMDKLVWENGTWEIR